MRNRWLCLLTICLLFCSCESAKNFNASASINIEYQNNCLANDFHFTAKIGLYPRGLYKSNYEDKVGAFFYVQNTTKTNGYAFEHSLDFESGTFLFKLVGFDDKYGFKRNDKNQIEYDFEDSFSLDERLFVGSKGYLTFYVGLYDIESNDTFSQAFRSTSVDCYYTVSENGVVSFNNFELTYEQHSFSNSVCTNS